MVGGSKLWLDVPGYLASDKWPSACATLNLSLSNFPKVTLWKRWSRRQVLTCEGGGKDHPAVALQGEGLIQDQQGQLTDLLRRWESVFSGLGPFWLDQGRFTSDQRRA